jgi:DNA-binding NarL/FixJ family response regulator
MTDTPDRALRVLLADDQSLVLAGLRTILDAEPDIEVVGQARDGYEAVRLARELRPNVVLMDVRMPGMDVVSAAERILADPGNTARVVMLTTFDLDEHAYAALRAGASGFLVKDIPDDQLVTGVRAVCQGDTLLAPSVSRRLIDAYVRRPPAGAAVSGADTLTPREVEVWRLVTAGRSNAEIAAELFLGEATVKTHVSRLLAKLDARDRIQLVVLGFEGGRADRPTRVHADAVRGDRVPEQPTHNVARPRFRALERSSKITVRAFVSQLPSRQLVRDSEPSWWQPIG